MQRWVQTTASFFSLTFILPLVAWALGGSSSAAERKPNFVYVFTDDQRWDALGVVQREQGDKGRFPWLRTPNLDRLAAEGVRFRNAFVVNALCAPSRATLVTGQYGHVNGVVNNHTPHPMDNLSLPALLRPAGYVSGYVGKWHHGNQSGSQHQCRVTTRIGWYRREVIQQCGTWLLQLKPCRSGQDTGGNRLRRNGIRWRLRLGA